MNYRLHENGWTVIIDDFDFAKATQDDINIIATLLLTNTLVIVPNQLHITSEDQIRVAKMFGELEHHNDIKHKVHEEAVDNIVLPGTDKQILRVTGAKNDKGKIGLFGTPDELDWHLNLIRYTHRKPIIWLKAESGSVGSRTSWTNHIAAYHDLSDEYKEKIKDLKVMCGWVKDKKTFSSYDVTFGGGWDEYLDPWFKPNLVHTNEIGVIGLFFSYLQMRQFEGWSEEDSEVILQYLRDHTLQEKYIYHHDWNDGDVVLTNQWFGVHKRWAFADIENRVLHRMAFDLVNSDITIAPQIQEHLKELASK